MPPKRISFPGRSIADARMEHPTPCGRPHAKEHILARSSSRRPRVTRAEMLGALLFLITLIWLILMAVSLGT